MSLGRTMVPANHHHLIPAKPGEEMTMFQKILIPLDGSELAEKVLPYVRQVATPTDTALILVRNIELSSYALAAESPTMSVRLLEALQEDAETYLAQQKEVWHAEGYNVQIEITRSDTATAIIHAASTLKADLIAMTTHGRTGIGRMTLGSVADRVVRSAHLPVLLVRAAAAGPVNEQISSILLPLDGSELSEQALPLARLLARKLGSRILLLQALEELKDLELAELFAQVIGEHGVPNDWYDEAVGYLDKMQKKLAFAGVASTYQVAVGQPAESILRAAAVEKCDLIVMSTHGRSGVGRWVYGSVASKVLHETECPLLLVRGQVHEEFAEIAPYAVTEVLSGD